jgi:glutaredoxin
LISKNPYQNVFIYDAPTKIDEVKEDQEESWSYYSEGEAEEEEEEEIE